MRTPQKLLTPSKSFSSTLKNTEKNVIICHWIFHIQIFYLFLEISLSKAFFILNIEKAAKFF